MAAKDEPRLLCVKSDVHDGGGVKVSVADTGTGIGSHDIDRIFDPLFTTKSDGIGMGLSLCRSIIKAHDGRLWVAPNIPQGAVTEAGHAPDLLALRPVRCLVGSLETAR